VAGTPKRVELLRRLRPGEPEVVVQEARPGLGGRPDLGAGSPEGVGDLLGVATLHPAAAALAPADLHPETGRPGFLGNVDLALLGVSLVLYFSAALGATARQGSVELPVRRAGRRLSWRCSTVVGKPATVTPSSATRSSGHTPPCRQTGGPSVVNGRAIRANYLFNALNKLPLRSQDHSLWFCASR